MRQFLLVSCVLGLSVLAEDRPRQIDTALEGIKGFSAEFVGGDYWVDTWPLSHVPKEFKGFKIKSVPTDRQAGGPVVLEQMDSGIAVSIRCNVEQGKNLIQPKVPQAWGPVVFKKKEFLDLPAAIGAFFEASERVTVYFAFRIDTVVFHLESKGSTRKEAEDAALAAATAIVEFKKNSKQP